jgi:hypothetical protein
MHDGVSRRGVLQLFAALTAAVPVLMRGASVAALPAADAPPPETPQAESVDAASRERRAIIRTFHPFEHRAVRAVFREGGRRG